MTNTWTISNRAAEIVRTGVAQYLRNPGPPDFDYCPAILWSLGRDAYLADGQHVALLPRYDLCIIRRTDIAAQNFVAIIDPAIGLVGFRPRPEDLRSEQKLIDYDGTDIVVR